MPKSTGIVLWPFPSLGVGISYSTRMGTVVPEGMLLLCHLIPRLNLEKLNSPCRPRFRGTASCTSTGTNSPSCSNQIKKEFGNMFPRVETFWGISASCLQLLCSQRNGEDTQGGGGHPRGSLRNREHYP